MSESFILVGDCREALRELSDASVHCCVTSPPYFGLRDYGVEGQLGLEPTPDEYVAKMVEVFREVRRVLRDDGTLWLNLGDSYAGSGRGGNPEGSPHKKQRTNHGSTALSDYGDSRQKKVIIGETAREVATTRRSGDDRLYGHKAKDLIGIPWTVAFALRADGWYLRSDIIWAKPNPMPESVRDRPTRSHENIFLLSKRPKYYYDADAVAEPATCDRKRGSGPMVNGGTGRNDAASGTVGDYRDKQSGHCRKHAGFNEHYFNGEPKPDTRNRRDVQWVDEDEYAQFLAWKEAQENDKLDVWTVTTKPFKGAHFATFPPDLIKPCILAGCPAGGVVLDVFFGAGTTGMVAERLGRSWIGCELNEEYAQMALERIRKDKLSQSS